MQIGNSPTLIAKAQLAEMLPRWDRAARAIHADPTADRDLGWAQEMFAFALALANAPTGPPHVRLQPGWMVQPPFQQALEASGCQVRARWSCCKTCKTCKVLILVFVVACTQQADVPVG